MNLKPLIRLAVAFTLPLLLTGCLAPIKSEIPLAGSSLAVKATNPNDTKLVIFNDSNALLYGLDGSGRINVSLDGKGVAQLNIGRYAQVIVPKGTYQLDLQHLDLARFSSHHQIDLKNSESFLEIRSTQTSNEAELVSRLPDNFERYFKPVKEAP